VLAAHRYQPFEFFERHVQQLRNAEFLAQQNGEFLAQQNGVVGVMAVDRLLFLQAI